MRTIYCEALAQKRMTLKIVHLIGQLRRGGAEKQLFQLATGLQDRGWQQTIISFDRGGIWKEPLEERGLPVEEISRHPLKPWRLWQLWRFVRRERPDVVLSWSTHLAVYARWVRGVGRLRRMVNVREDLTVDTNSGQTSAYIERLRSTLQQADFVVSNSEWGLEALRRVGVALPRTAVIRNIVPPTGRATPAMATEVPRIVAVGKLNLLKAQHVLLQALGTLAAEKRKFELLMAGDGPERARLCELAKQLGLADRVRFLGDVDDMPRLLATAHLLVHPSKSEGLSNAILEGMAEGLPVVASAVGGNPEIVADGVSGLLVPPERPDLLAAAIRRLLDDPSLRGRFGAEGLQWVRCQCSQARVVGQYENAFQGLFCE